MEVEVLTTCKGPVYVLINSSFNTTLIDIPLDQIVLLQNIRDIFLQGLQNSQILHYESTSCTKSEAHFTLSLQVQVIESDNPQLQNGVYYGLNLIVKSKANNTELYALQTQAVFTAQHMKITLEQHLIQQSQTLLRDLSLSWWEDNSTILVKKVPFYKRYELIALGLALSLCLSLIVKQVINRHLKNK